MSGGDATATSAAAMTRGSAQATSSAESITEEQFVENGPGFVRTVEQDGNLKVFETTVGDKTIKFDGLVTKTETTLTLDQLDIQGANANELGVKKLIEIAKQLGRQEGVQEVIINGAKRTTGANPGRIPSSITIKVN